MSKQANRFGSRRPSARELRGLIAYAAWINPRDLASVAMPAPAPVTAEKTSAGVGVSRDVASQQPKEHRVMLAWCSDGSKVYMAPTITSFSRRAGRIVRRVDVL